MNPDWEAIEQTQHRIWEEVQRTDPAPAAPLFVSDLRGLIRKLRDLGSSRGGIAETLRRPERFGARRRGSLSAEECQMLVDEEFDGEGTEAARA